MTSQSSNIRDFKPQPSANKYIPKTGQNTQEFRPKQVNHQQNQTSPPPPPVRHNAFNFGIKAQNSSNHNSGSVNSDKNLSWQNHDYKPKLPEPEKAPNPQPRNFDPNYEPQIKPEDVIPGNAAKPLAINPLLIVQKK
mgnify:CR=1 FL=1